MSEITEDSLIIPGPRPPGRPRTVCADGDGSRVTVYLPAEYHDRLIKLAQKRDQPVSALIRSLLMLRLP